MYDCEYYWSDVLGNCLNSGLYAGCRFCGYYCESCDNSDYYDYDDDISDLDDDDDFDDYDDDCEY